jgi:hypothetical protein
MSIQNVVINGLQAPVTCSRFHVKHSLQLLPWDVTCV